MKKIIRILIFIFMLLLFTSCALNIPQEKPTSEYSIKYYVEGVLVHTDTYKEGENLDLYVYPINPDEEAVFDGWYDNPAYTGDLIVKIDQGLSGNINLYGRILEEEIKINLFDLLTISNYCYSISDLSSDDVYEYQVTETAQSFYCEDFGEYSYYLESLPDCERVLYNDNGNWFHSLQDENIYLSFVSFFNLIDLTSINTNGFYFDEDLNSFVCEENALNDTAKEFAKNYVTINECTNFVIELNEEKTEIKNIKISVIENSVENIYTFSFSNINKTVVRVPESTYDEGSYGGPVQNKISSLHDYYSGEDCSATGVVTGVYGNNFYLTDNSGSILVYCGNNTTYLPIIEEGKVITVKGSISIYKDIAQIVDLIEVSVENKNLSVTAKDLTSISQTTLSNMPAEYVNVKKATLVNVPTYSTTSDMSFKIRFNNETVDVFISRHLDYTYKNALVDSLENIGVNGKIDLLNLHVSKYTDYQLVCTSVTNFKKNTDSLVLSDINVTPTKVSIEEGATIDDVLDKFTLSKVFDDYSSDSLSISEVEYQTNFVSNKIGTFTITFIYKNLTKDATIEVYEKGLGYIETNVSKAPNKEAARNFDLTTGLPSIGNPKVLVIPVSFIDYPAKTNIVSDLEKAFFGTSEETGWESLQSYYLKSSYGKLNITGTVLEPYKTNNYASYYNNIEDADYMMIEAALKYYNDQINYADYDTDKDGYIDSIYIVYTRPYDEDGDSNWWAYTYEYFTEDVQSYDGVEADFYTFMSIDFIYDELQGQKVNYNAETIIHETGHLLGLDDYYDYTAGTGPDGGIGGGDMMDYNVGDHNAFSKVLLGWVNPYVLTGSNVTMTLGSFEQTGECIIVPKNWNGSFYSEYFIIDFYTPTGINSFVKGESGLFATYGIRVYHIDAELASYNDASVIYAMTKYNNSDTVNRLISLIEADGRNDISDNGWSEDSDLFTIGKTLSNPKWHNNTSSNFTMKVNSINTTYNNEKAQVTFTFN